MIAYRLEMLGPEQISEQDPFGGNGIRLHYADGLSQEEAGPRLNELFGAVPYVAFPSCAWLDARGLPAGIPRESAGDLWRGR